MLLLSSITLRLQLESFVSSNHFGQEAEIYGTEQDSCCGDRLLRIRWLISVVVAWHVRPREEEG